MDRRSFLESLLALVPVAVAVIGGHRLITSNDGYNLVRRAYEATIGPANVNFDVFQVSPNGRPYIRQWRDDLNRLEPLAKVDHHFVRAGTRDKYLGTFRTMPAANGNPIFTLRPPD